MTSLSLLCTHSLTSPPEPQKSPLTGPHAHPNPRPPASPTLFQPSPPPPAPRQSWWEGGHRSPGPGLGMPGCTGEHICPEHHRQGLASCPSPASRALWAETLSEADPAVLAGTYLHTIVLLVSSTLPACRGEKVEGYQHQAGHQGPQGEEEQHPRAAEGTEPEQRRGETSSPPSSSFLGGPGSAGGPLGGSGPGFSAVSSVTLWLHGLREVPDVSQDRGIAVSVWGFPPDPGHHPC